MLVLVFKCRHLWSKSFIALQRTEWSKWLYVIYWPSTEPSIKRCTCVNKRKNSGSRWTLDDDITRCPVRFELVGDRMPAEWEPAPDTGLGPTMLHGWATQAKMRKKCCYGRRRTWGQYSSLSPSPTLFSHITNITLSRIKCKRYIFIKNCIRSFIEVGILCLIMFLFIFVLRRYETYFWSCRPLLTFA